MKEATQIAGYTLVWRTNDGPGFEIHVKSVGRGSYATPNEVIYLIGGRPVAREDFAVITPVAR